MPQINIALDAFAFIIMLIIFLSCLEERIKQETRSNCYLFTLCTIMLALAADTASWIGEGNPSLATLTVIGNVTATCAGYLAIFFFIMYLREKLFRSSRSISAVVLIVAILCAVSMAVVIFNAYYQVAFKVDIHGHYVHENSQMIILGYLQFPIIALLITTLMMICSRGVGIRERIYYISYLFFPTVGVILDYTIHGLSLTYIGMTVSAVIIYANLHMKKRKLIAEQRTALMMSQINPHFMYNTLTTIASLCEIEPKEAKALTVEFSTFLRQNLDTLKTTELIPFEQELRHVGCYLKIEKARFKESVDVIYSIGAKDFMLPALTVQPLVENAVKHGITKKQGGGTVKISTFRRDDCCVIEIIDNGVGFDSERMLHDGRTHIGIENVRSRLKDMCAGTLEIRSMVGVGTRATVEIPNKRRKRK